MHVRACAVLKPAPGHRFPLALQLNGGSSGALVWERDPKQLVLSEQGDGFHQSLFRRHPQAHPRGTCRHAG